MSGQTPRKAPSEKWSEALSAWALPQSIIAQAEESPWIHPVALFGVPDLIPSSPSHARAHEVCLDNSTFLDVGCGGGIAAFAAVPPVRHVIGVDHQPEMLELFSLNASLRGVTSETYEGFWPDIAPKIPMADIVAAHHVVYNVSNIIPFLNALDLHARRRVVLEMPIQHPLSSLSRAWKHFWNLDRPLTPSPSDLMAVLEEMGISANIEQWTGPTRLEQDLESLTEITRVRLCLPKSRAAEVKGFLEGEEFPSVRQLATIWWDKKGGEYGVKKHQ